MYGCDSWTIKKAEHWRTDTLNCSFREDSWESVGLQGDGYKSVLNIHWKDWCWSWNFCHLMWRTDSLEKTLKLGKMEGRRSRRDDRGRDSWMTSPTWWTWIWASSESWWWTGRPGMLQSMGSWRVVHDWVTELNCTELARSRTMPLHIITIILERVSSVSD